MVETSVAVGIVLYNSSDSEVASCLESIATSEYERTSIRIYIRDNSGGLFETLVRRLLDSDNPSGNPYYYESGDNVGFGAAHNILMSRAFEESGCDSYLCLNPDAILHPTAIQQLLTFANTLNMRGLFEAIQFPIGHPKSYDQRAFTTPWCSGCCLLIPKTIYVTLGGFDERFWMYCEDVDLSWRVKAAGLQCYAVPSAKVFHFVMDRANDDYGPSSIGTMMCLAGAQLGQKWGGKAFRDGLIDEYERRTGVRPEISELGVASPLTHRERLMAQPDFSNGFTFAMPRWIEL